jgi:hypothetical protein
LEPFPEQQEVCQDDHGNGSINRQAIRANNIEASDTAKKESTVGRPAICVLIEFIALETVTDGVAPDLSRPDGKPCEPAVCAEPEVAIRIREYPVDDIVG